MSFTHQDWTPIVLNKNTNTNKTPKQTHPHVQNTVKVQKIYDPENPDAEPDVKPVMVDKEFGMLIQKFRTAKGLTQKQLAAAINLPVQVISEYERGTGVRNGNYVSKIKKYLGITKNNS